MSADAFGITGGASMREGAGGGRVVAWGRSCGQWLLALSLLALTPGSPAETLQRPGVPVPREYFGLHIHRAHSVTPWPPVTFGAWRLIDAYVNWFNLEPRKEAWDFRTLDQHVKLAGDHGVEVVLPLAFPPTWASSRPDEKGPYGLGSAAPPRDLRDWRGYVERVARRYRGRIRDFELWNEPNIKGFFSGTPEQLVALARSAREILRSVSGKNRLVSPGVVGEGTHLQWLESYLQLGGARYADIVGYHFYTPKDPPEAMLPLIKDVRAIMARRGLKGKPLWNTESGWWIANTDGTPEKGSVDVSWRRLESDLAGAYVARALVLGWVAGLDRFYWYAWDNYSMGLIEPKEKAVKPAGRAYQATMDWLVGAVVSVCSERTGRLWVCELSRGVNEEALIVWSTEGTQNFWLPPGWVADRVESLDGGSSSADRTTRSVAVTEWPVRIIRAKHKVSMGSR